MSDQLSIPKTELFSAIQASAWFKGLADDAVSWLASHAKAKTYAQGESVYLAGQERESVYGLLNGSINLSLVGDGRQVFSLMKFHQGFWFGESALINSQSKVLEVEAIEVSNIIEIPAQELRLIADQYLVIYRNLYLDKMRQSQLLYDMVTSVLTYPLTARISLRLLAILDERGIETVDGVYLSPALSTAELAELSMGSTQRVKIIVKKWIERRYIIIQDDMWLVPDKYIFEAEAAK